MDLPITQLPHHVADVETANAMRPPIGGAGLIVGQSRAGRPLIVRMFDNEPRSYVVVGGLRLLQLLTVRLVALNCRVVVRTERPSAWGPLVRTLAGTSGAVVVAADGTPPPGSPHRPSVLVIDSASSVESAAPAGSPWSAVISGYDALSQWNANALDYADGAFLHQLSPTEATLVEGRMAVQHLHEATQGGAPGTLAVVARGSIEVAQALLTSYERWVLGTLER